MTQSKRIESSNGRIISVTVALLALAFLAGCVVWAYWTTLAVMVDKWAHDAQYSHGYLVPIFAVVLLWLRRDRLDLSKLAPSWWGVPVLFAGLAMRQAGVYFFYEWFDALSLLPCLAGVCLLLGGVHAFRWSWPSIAFLFFMIPLPFTLEVTLQGPLRRLGTVVSTYLMQTIGLPAIREGNVVVVDDYRIGVVEACSGLRMLMIFFALSSAICLLSRRNLWMRAVIIASAVPIALISNITRITVTGILFVTVNSQVAEFVFHDVAGWLMMPLALALHWAELWVLTRLVIVEEERPMSMGLLATNQKPEQSADRTEVEVAVPR